VFVRTSALYHVIVKVSVGGGGDHKLTNLMGVFGLKENTLLGELRNLPNGLLN
jgi:hypothetical protein